VKRQVEGLEGLAKATSAGDAPSRLGGGHEGRTTQRELRHALGRSVLALAPPQVQRLQQLLTSPQRGVLSSAVREVRLLLLEQDQER
jgi:hypothetical protein